MHPEPDPVLRELRLRRAEYRRLLIFTMVIFGYLALATAAALWIRSSDLQTLARRAAASQVKACFESSARRPLLREAVADTSLPEIARDLARTELEKTPNVAYCRDLADELNISPVDERNP
jgi:hypothetical protein